MDQIFQFKKIIKERANLTDYNDYFEFQGPCQHRYMTILTTDHHPPRGHSPENNFPGTKGFTVRSV